MASSDDEAESPPESVSNYHFVDNKDEPVSFSVLPIQWEEGESPDGKKEHIFLHGTVDNGLHRIYKHVIAWRFDLSSSNREISVLSKQNNWLKLQKPRKSFEGTIRTILITVQCLHFLKKFPGASGKSLWDHLSKLFSLYEVRPSLNDLLEHVPLLIEAVKRDDDLAKSQFLCSFLEDKPRNRKLSDEVVQTTTMSGFIVDDTDEDIMDEEGDESNEIKDLFDSVCAFCDNGGDILCCEGRCMRSFHATVEAGVESVCVSLGFSQEEVDKLQNFICKNCEYRQHQCFACGELGSSDKFSGAEVFPCVSATCGYFYHPHCVAKLLHQENEVSVEELEKKIAAGGSFTCPIHKCCVCKQGENKKNPQLQFAICRRCPKSYHRKCLPREIAFQDSDDGNIITRAWEGLLPNRILIYCINHDIDEEIGTPVRDHIKFPGVKMTVEKKKATMGEKKIQASESFGNEVKDLPKKKNLALDYSRRKMAVEAAKMNWKPSLPGKVGSTKSEKKLSPSNNSRKLKVKDVSRKVLNENKKSLSKDVGRSSTDDENKSTFSNRLYDIIKGSGQVKSAKQDMPDVRALRTVAVKTTAKSPSSALPPLDAESERRLLALMEDAASSVTLEEVKTKHKSPCTQAYSSRNNVEKTITLGKLEGSVEAVRAALGKLEEGCSCEDAEAVCDPDVLNQIFKWKYKLKVYLSPFLYGNRYTSFGRHFTKVEKLEQIVDKLHWYAKNGDMIVDFCCGANDFSILMKKKLEETGKKCFFKNYDIVHAKNDFNFEKRDWMTVQPKELPKGSQLIMGLNPPFGVRASLANRFINKALEFKPKLLILIVPPEAQRLDEKKISYDLVWEDDQSLAGKSFYLPGSVDGNDKQMDQWNVKPPPLYLWSRPDWTAEHKAIAQKHGHLPNQQEESEMENDHPMNISSNHPLDDHDYHDKMSIPIDLPPQSDTPEKFRGGSVVMEFHKESSSCHISDRGSLASDGHGKKQPNETSQRKRKRGKEKQRRGMGEMTPGNKMEGGRPRSPPIAVDNSFLLEGLQSKSLETPPHAEIGENNHPHQHFEPVLYTSRVATYGGSPASISNERSRNYSSSVEPYAGGTHRPFHGVSPRSDYRTRDLDEQFARHMRESSDNVNFRPYIPMTDPILTRDLDVRSKVRLYGQDDYDSARSNYRGSHDARFHQVGLMPYGHPVPTDMSFRMSTSSMLPYPPPVVHQLNHQLNGYGFDNPRARQPGFQSNPLGFASGHRSYSRHGSSGWPNE